MTKSPHTSRGALEELRIARAEFVTAIELAVRPELELLAAWLERTLDRLAVLRFEIRRRIPPDWWIYPIGAIASVLLGWLIASA